MTLTVLLFGFIYFFWLSFHWKILIMWLSQFPLTFHQTQNWDAPFHYIAFGYSRADLDSLCDHLRDVPWEDIFKLSSSSASEFCEWVQFGIDLYILHRQYQVKPHSSPWLSVFFVCSNRIVLPNLK